VPTLKISERSQINNETIHLKLLQKQEQAKHQSSSYKEIIKMSEISAMETKRTISRLNETKSWFLEKISKTDKPLVKLTKRKREKAQINKIRDEKLDIAINSNDT
jgi:phage major head subunit gpT-like protein